MSTTSTDRDSTLSRLNFGVYKAQQLVGKGGMAKVYRCVHTETGKIVAIKLVIQQQKVEEALLRRFEREIEAMKKVSHPYIVKLLDYSLSPEQSFLVMPYFPNGSLADRIATKLYTPREVSVIVSNLAFALDYAHSQGYIHRDIKPSNILLDDKGKTYLSDFGLAKSLETHSMLTSTGQLFGTFAYMAPELMDGAPADVRTDVYAMGIVMCELLTGHRPFQADNPVAYAYLHRRAMPPAPSQLNPNVPTVLNEVILAALEKSPRNRPQSAGELAHLFSTKVNENPTIADICAPRLPRPEIATIPVKGATGSLPTLDGKAPDTITLNAEDLNEPVKKQNEFVGTLMTVLFAAALGLAALLVLMVVLKR